MTRDLIRRGDNERLVLSETSLPQLTDIRVGPVRKLLTVCLCGRCPGRLV